MEFCTSLFNLYFVLIFILDLVWGLRITKLNVPVWVDPRANLTLECLYDMGGEELYSVKWYKDDHEFFRYTPRQQPHVMSFPVAGVHLVADDVTTSSGQCRVHLTRLNTAHSGGAYKCEVSTEAPKFRVSVLLANVTVAAVGRAAPALHGLRAHYSLGDLLHVNCTADLADPPPTLTWLLNGAKPSANDAAQVRLSAPDVTGLVQASQDLRFHVERRHFPPPDHALHLQCVATPPVGVPAPPLVSTPSITPHLHDPHSTLATRHQQRNVNQKLEWFNSKASTQNFQQGLLLSVVLILFCWR